MAVPFSNTKLRVPKGFQNILEGLAREVLRAQPEDIYSYGAMYFENLLKIREEGGVDPAQHGAKLEDRFYNNQSFKAPDVDPANPQQQEAATAIQTKFRQYEAKKQVKQMQEEKAAVTIQAGVRGYQDRKKVSDMRKESQTALQDAKEDEKVDIDDQDQEVWEATTKIQAGYRGYKARQEVAAKREAEKLERLKAEEPDEPTFYVDVDDPDVQNAAVKIQANYRGYRVRAAKHKKKQEEEEVDIDLTDPDVEKAAIKIQAGIRGHLTRKGMKDKEEAKETAAAEDEDAEPATDEAEDEPAADAEKTTEGEEIDIDLDDPEVAQAATKIQASFRGHKTRKQMSVVKAEKQATEEAEAATEEEAAPPAEEETKQEEATEEQEKKEEEEIDIDLTDPEVENAAVKIQASFKGFKTRKEMAEKKASTTEAAATEDAPAEETPAEEAPAGEAGQK